MRSLRMTWKVAASSAGIAAIATGIVAGVALSGSNAAPATTGRQVPAGQSVAASTPTPSASSTSPLPVATTSAAPASAPAPVVKRAVVKQQTQQEVTVTDPTTTAAPAAPAETTPAQPTPERSTPAPYTPSIDPDAPGLPNPTRPAGNPHPTPSG